MHSSIDFGGRAVLRLEEFGQILSELPRGSKVRVAASCFKKGPKILFVKLLRHLPGMILLALQREANAVYDALVFSNDFDRNRKRFSFVNRRWQNSTLIFPSQEKHNSKNVCGCFPWI